MFGAAIFGDYVYADLYDLAFIPGAGRGGAGGSGFYPVDVSRLLDRLYLDGLDSLDEDEVAILLLFGLI